MNKFHVKISDIFKIYKISKKGSQLDFPLECILPAFNNNNKIFHRVSDFSRNYDTTLYRLAAHQEDCWRGVAPSLQGPLFNPEPPLLAAKFAKKVGNQHILAIANEDGKVRFFFS